MSATLIGAKARSAPAESRYPSSIKEVNVAAFQSLGDEPKWVCVGCVRDEFLYETIEVMAPGECSYCEEISSPRISIDGLAELVEAAIQGHYERTSTEPDAFQYAMHNDREIEYDWERDGDPIADIIADRVGCDESIAIDILEILSEAHDRYDPSDGYDEESEFSSESQYQPKQADSGDWAESWNRLEHALKHESRLFNHEAFEILASVFSGLDRSSSKSGGVAIVPAGPSPEGHFLSLYRAREFQSSDALGEALKKPADALGPPPGRLAKAGRMNASGISVFYGALEAGSALAEVRPVVGSKVVVAKFELLRDVQLLDLRALESLTCEGSIFDPNYALELSRHSFLNILSKRLVLPVMPNDQDHEYLITQAVADYLASLQEPTVDGIIFPSVQDGIGVNVVLFHKASMVEPLKFPPSTSFRVQLEDIDYETGEPYSSYHLQIEQPEQLPKPSLIDDFWDSRLIYAKHRTPALGLDLESISVHTIKAVEIKTEEDRVSVTYTKQRGAVEDPSF